MTKMLIFATFFIFNRVNCPKMGQNRTSRKITVTIKPIAGNVFGAMTPFGTAIAF